MSEEQMIKKYTKRQVLAGLNEILNQIDPSHRNAVSMQLRNLPEDIVITSSDLNSIVEHYKNG